MGGEPAGRDREAAFFDLDKTVIARSSTMAFSRPFHTNGLLSRSAMLRSAYVHFLYHASGADHTQMERMRQQVSRMVIGWEVQQVSDIVATTLSELIVPIVYEEATALIAEHHEAGRDVVIVSASGVELVEPIGAMLGADHVIATRMGIDEGRYTGTIEYYAYGENKAAAMRRMAVERGYRLERCYAYSDSVTDLPMLQAVGHPVAVNPDKALRREAQTRGWLVQDFSRPVSLRPKFPAQAAARTAALGAGASAAAGLVWYASRRNHAGRQSSGREFARSRRAASRPE
ncbi:HAD-IB family hydrolase [Kineosporia rhizophila]|uniref:HAD family hydrolase n=1 Tax=Kineosporia TaxID=49184 RepID=UPI001E417252|nr:MULTISPECIES: HAD family hydrolase [Kineosporia]MCE0535979.1 HAD-IB family hydrolase [Kineosporia rhizophila]GLY14191.1 morphological differentiation-associated protein [Kineosporia sp. NBRC 101677]